MALHELERYRASETNDNAIVSAKEEFSTVERAKRIMKARETAAQITLSMNDLVASKNDAKRYVDFSDKNTGDKVFRDDGEKIIMHSKKADINHTAAALTLAAEKFGVVKINGTKEFKDQVIDVAVSKDLNIVFADKKMEADFVRRKEELKRDVIVETMDSARSKSEAATEPKEHVPHEAANTQLKEEVLKSAKFEVDYKWDKLSGKLQVTINGKAPNRFEQSTVEQIVKKDAFLKHYTIKEVQSGLIDQKKAKGVQPVPKYYDAQVNVIDKSRAQKQSCRIK